MEIYNFYKNLSNLFDIHKVKNSYVIVTPLLYSDNDNIEIIVKQKENKIILSDDGNTINRIYDFDLSKINLRKFGIKFDLETEEFYKEYTNIKNLTYKIIETANIFQKIEFFYKNCFESLK